MSPHTENKLQWSSAIIRVLVGMLFIYMGLGKALEPVGFLKLVRQYDLPLQYWMLNSIAAALPWFEVFCGALLVMGIAVRGAALVTAAMLIPFTVVVFLRALEISDAQQLAFCAVNFDCGCGAGEVNICGKLLENLVLVLASIWLVGGYGRPLSLRYSILAQPSKSAVSPASKPAHLT